jgi:integrase
MEISIQKATQINQGGEAQRRDITFKKMVTEYFDVQESYKDGDPRKKQKSTLEENKRESKNLLAVFGEMHPSQITTVHVQQYLTLRANAGASSKANKEVALLSAIFRSYKERGIFTYTPCEKIVYLKIAPKNTYVSQQLMEIFREVGESHGGQWYRMLKSLELAYLTTSRADEIRYLKTNQIKKDGLLIPITKRKSGQAQKSKLVEWTPELEKTIDEILATYEIKPEYLFCNQSGMKYTRSGWGSTWKRFKTECKKIADERQIDWVDFSLTDMRPASVTDRVLNGETQIRDTTGHTSDQMINTVYDRRVVKKVKPVTKK